MAQNQTQAQLNINLNPQQTQMQLMNQIPSIAIQQVEKQQPNIFSVRTGEQQNDHAAIGNQKQTLITQLAAKNRLLIEKLKLQNISLTKKINKIVIKPKKYTQFTKRNKTISAITQQQIKPKQIQVAKRQLNNVYKQITMYQREIGKLKKVNTLNQFCQERKNQMEEIIHKKNLQIQNIQKEIEYSSKLRQKQQKEIKVFESQDTKRQIQTLQMQLTHLKNRTKNIKQSNMKRQQVQKKQQQYQIQLQTILRNKQKNIYKNQFHQQEDNLTPQTLKQHYLSQDDRIKLQTKVKTLKQTHENNSKKIQQLTKNLKKFQNHSIQNELKLKQKTKRLTTINHKIQELNKLLIVINHEKKLKTIKNQNMKKNQTLHQTQNIQLKQQQTIRQKQTQIKKNIEVYQFSIGQASKIVKSDKQFFQQNHDIKIKNIHIWIDPGNIPRIIQLEYINNQMNEMMGNTIQNIPQNLIKQTISIDPPNKLQLISIEFSNKQLVSLSIKTKQNEQCMFKSQRNIQINQQQLDISINDNEDIRYFEIHYDISEGNVKIKRFCCYISKDKQLNLSQ